MGLIKGTITFSRYHVAGDLPQDFSAFFDRELKKYAFDNSSVVREKSLGWTGLENVLDRNFEYASYHLGECLVFSLRIDRRTIPPALLRLRILEAEKARAEETGRRRLSRSERKDIKEQVRQRLLEKVPAIPSFHDVIWCPAKGWLIIGTTAPSVMEDFEKYFDRSFSLKLVPALPWTGEEDIPPLPGREFLTWLWFKSEERNGTMLVPGLGDIEVVFSRRVVFESGEGEYTETVVCQGLHADLSEGKTALRRAKKIREARLGLGIGTDRMECTIKADRFLYQSLNILSDFDEEEEEREAKLLYRTSAIERMVDTMEKLFALFLERRRSAAWEQEELPRMKKWMEQGR
ncbi:MAG: recombination-associated protein RdgC [Deltaproteobacteria bacterium]|nr:recombination-associated protein RdgC [Deltaproteobacteria bacterium]